MWEKKKALLVLLCWVLLDQRVEHLSSRAVIRTLERRLMSSKLGHFVVASG